MERIELARDISKGFGKGRAAKAGRGVTPEVCSVVCWASPSDCVLCGRVAVYRASGCRSVDVPGNEALTTPLTNHGAIWFQLFRRG